MSQAVTAKKSDPGESLPLKMQQIATWRYREKNERPAELQYLAFVTGVSEIRLFGEGCDCCIAVAPGAESFKSSLFNDVAISN